MGVPVRDFLKKRRDRAVGSILGWAEREVFKDLSDAQRKAFREKVLDAMNAYHDAVLDLVSAEDGVVRNDRLVELLETLDGRLQAEARSARVQTPVHSAP